MSYHRRLFLCFMEIHYFSILAFLVSFVENFDVFKLFSRQNGSQWRKYTTTYSYFSESERIELREEAKEMFYFGYDNYIKYAYPMDELDPIHCTGRGPDYENPYVIYDLPLTLFLYRILTIFWVFYPRDL